MQRCDFLFEEDYASRVKKEVLPALMSARKEWYYHTTDGAKLFVVRYDAKPARGSVVILHGHGESAEKYREMCYYFLKSGLTVLIFEQRGHGRSTRTVPTGLTHIRHFSQYVEDFDALMSDMAQTLPSPRYLYAHSMGGAVAALYLERSGAHFEKAVLSSPMIAMQYKRVPRPLGYAACVAMGVLGLSKRRFVGMGAAPLPAEERVALSGADSEVRFLAYRTIKEQEPLLRASRPTVAWVREALGCTREILKKGAPERIGIPVRIYAAEHEVLVSEGPQQEFAKRVPKGEFCPVSGVKHEIYFSTDDKFHPYMREILAFFS